MALILNIETATEVCSVALANEQGLIDMIENGEGKSHASLLTVFIEELIAKNKISIADLDAVAVSMGPGSYTGLRIGVSVAKGLCFGNEKPLIAVSTLQSMASGFVIQQNLKEQDEFKDAWLCPMIDARRMEVYAAFFDMHGTVQQETSAIILDERSFEDILAVRKVIFFGNGVNKFSNLLIHPNAFFNLNYQLSAKNMVLLSQKQYETQIFQDVAYFEPFYLKDFFATTPKNKVLKN